MGISAAILGVTAGISAVSEVYKGVEGHRSAVAEENALSEREKQVESQTRSKQINNLEKVNQAIGSQMVVGASNGYDLSSTSFNAVTADTLDKYEQDRNADLLSENYQKEAYEQGIENAKAQGRAAIVGSIANIAGNAASMFGGEMFSGGMGAGSGVSTLGSASQSASGASAASSVLGENSVPNIGLDYNSYLKYQKGGSLFSGGGI